MKIFLMPHLCVPLKSLKFNYRKMMSEKEKKIMTINKQIIEILMTIIIIITMI